MIGFYLAIGLGKLLSWLPFRAMYAFSNLLSFTMMHLIAYRKEVIMHNLRNAFPQKKEAELQAIRKGFYRNFSDIMVESLKSLSISEKTIRKHFKLKNPELFEQLLSKKPWCDVSNGALQQL
ncbi:MAG: hypothetical protein U5L96_11030 [Owenweeksia sp.]|nr:hypothetical protein [Owenweeksia sp.]